MTNVTTDFASFTVILALITYHPRIGVLAAVAWLLMQVALTVVFSADAIPPNQDTQTNDQEH